MNAVRAPLSRRIASWGFAALCLAACSAPQRDPDEIARRSGFTQQVVAGDGFLHRIYRNAAAAAAGTGTLHVYIEGDGSPYVRPDRIAADPTPHDPLMLRLMALDPSPSVYLGRPCYFEPDRDPACRSAFWTLRRYGPEVLRSMGAALHAERERAQAGRLVLFGHSGGGTLAVLLADRDATVARVVTIGAILDLRAWCRLHQYSPLAGSIDPAEAPPRAGIEVLHLVGDRDRNAPPWLIGAAARARGGEAVRIVPHRDHNCCWEPLWPAILAESP